MDRVWLEFDDVRKHCLRKRNPHADDGILSRRNSLRNYALKTCLNYESGNVLKVAQSFEELGVRQKHNANYPLIWGSNDYLLGFFCNTVL